MNFKRLFGNLNEKEVKKIQPLVDNVNQLEQRVGKLSDTKIKARVLEIKEEIQKKVAKEIRENEEKKSKNEKINKILEPHIPEVFALVREVSKRRLKMRHFDVQLIGG